MKTNKIFKVSFWIVFLILLFYGIFHLKSLGFVYIITYCLLAAMYLNRYERRRGREVGWKEILLSVVIGIGILIVLILLKMVAFDLLGIL